MTPDRLGLLADALYDWVFAQLDAEPELDGEMAGKIAGSLQTYYVRLLVHLVMEAEHE